MKTSKRGSRKIWIGMLTLFCFILISCSSGDSEDKNSYSSDSSEGSSNENLQSSGEGNLNSEATTEQAKAPEISFNLESYSIPGVLTINKPVGWNFYKAGDYNTLAFLTRDETEPLRQVFLFGEVGLFYTNQNQKDVETNYQNNGGYNVQWLDMPVVSPLDGQTFFENFYSIMNTQIGNGFRGTGQMPVPAGFEQLNVISQQQIDSTVYGLPTYLVRAVLSGNGKAAQGMFIASPVSDAFGHATAYIVAGVTAPTREFDSVQGTLTEVLNSFTMDPSYVQRGVDMLRENGQRFREISQTLSETSDIITRGYTERNKLEDVRIEKLGDQIMGVDRIYNPDTGVVYEVENGFFDYYDIHREDYPESNLQPLPDNDFNVWGEAPIINHSYVRP